MASFKLLDETAIEDFVRGCTLLATGGGGLPANGRASLLSELEADDGPGWVSLSDIADDAVVACPFLMGSIAPLTPEVIREMASFGFTSETSRNVEKARMAQALTELEEYVGCSIDAIVPIELAGANTSAAVAAAKSLGRIVLNGDLAGRAIPEIHQTTPYLAGMDILPISSVDEWGNVAIIRNATDYRVTERIGKLISAAGYGLAGQAGFLMTGAQAREVIIPGTLTEAYEIGRFIRLSRTNDTDVVAALVDALQGLMLFEGEITAKDDEDKLGYYWGTHTISGNRNWAGDSMKVWFKNENHVCWLNDRPFVTSPDLICIVDRDSGEPIPNPLVEPGQSVAVIAIPARQQFRSQQGIDVLGPRYFGFDFDHTPVLETFAQDNLETLNVK